MNALKTFSFVLLLPLANFAAESAADAARTANTVILDATGVKNLRIETVVAEPGTFEETIFALGRIDVFPGRRAAISSRIAGRALEVNISHDHPIKKGDAAIIIESRQIGNPPPRITLDAPISGLVSKVNVIPGEPVDPDKILAEIIDVSEVYAIARVPEHLAGRLKIGLDAHVIVAASSGRTYTAKLEHFGAIADAESGTVEAAFHLDNPDLALRPGMRAEFSIVVSQRNDVTSVPRSAIQGTAANRFVYVRDFDLPNAFIKTPVVTGQSNDRSVEIVSGLFPADEVVTRGAYSLSFAGGNSLSLKEAMDAAHGHSHNEDGSEMSSSPAGKSTSTSSVRGNSHDGHDHSGHAHSDDDHDHDDAMPALPWMISTGVLAIALFVVALRKRNRRA